MHYEIRAGNRGGRDLFKWDDLKFQTYKDREQYLGFSTKIGYLDKGGKWRKRDWYAKEKNGPLGKGGDSVADEIRRVKEEDDRRMRVALGLEKPSEEIPKLSESEILELNQKIKTFDPDNEAVEEERVHGLGFEAGKTQGKHTHKRNGEKEGQIQLENVHRLEGLSLDTNMAQNASTLTVPSTKAEKKQGFKHKEEIVTKKISKKDKKHKKHKKRDHSK